MTYESLLRTDILSSEIIKNPIDVKVIAEQKFNAIVNIASDRTKSPGNSKNIIESMDLIRQAILDYEDRLNTNKDAKVSFVYENPDKDIDSETISIGFVSRLPGSWGQGSVEHRSKITNQRPILRELIEDPDNPGYKRAIFGYFYDNILRLTCWAKTNKVANERALWLETVMEEYAWFFTFNGINRILFKEWKRNEVIEISGNKLYGRPMDFFVRTEKIRNVSQKKLEQIIIRMAPIENI